MLPTIYLSTQREREGGGGVNALAFSFFQPCTDCIAMTDKTDLHAAAMDFLSAIELCFIHDADCTACLDQEEVSSALLGRRDTEWSHSNIENLGHSSAAFREALADAIRDRLVGVR